MRNFFSMVALAAVSVLLGSCGGGAFQSTSSTTSTTTATVASLGVTSDVANIPSDGSSGANITVVAKDANNAVVSGLVISFTASSGGNVTATQATTDSTGTAKATLVAGTATPGASITVTATSGSITGTTAVTVVPTASSLTVTSDVTSIPSDGSTGANITVVAKNASSAPVAGVTISFTANNGGNVTATQATTDATGTAKATLAVGTATAGSTITVTATSGAHSGTVNVTVANAKKTLTLLTNLASIPSDNSVGATIQAIVKDANNNLLAGVPVSFQVNSGAIAPAQTKAGAAASPAVPAGTTDATGTAQATLTTPGDASNRTITVNATAGSATAQLNVSVGGTNLTVTGPGTLVLNNTATYTVTLSNSSAQGVPNIPVTLSSANHNTLTVTSASSNTDSNGRVTFTLTGTTGGKDTITATALGLTQTATVTVSTQSFSFTAPADQTKVNLSTPQTVTIKWTNNGTAVSGQPVTFAATRGTIVAPTTVNTAADGTASVSISSTTAGASIVQATATGVSAQLNLDFVAVTPSQIAVQAGPTAIAIQGQSTITAIVRDAQNNLVEGATVNFQVTADPTNGTLAAASAVTDSTGHAQVVYTAGNTSSGANGVTFSATVAGTSITGSAQLTVGGQAVFLSLGTGNTIDDTQGVAIYQVTYTVLAVDSHGAPLANQPISYSVLPVAYGKGILVCGTGAQYWSPQYSTATTDLHAYNNTKLCTNEDTDYTGNIASLDTGTPGTCTNLSTGATITSHVKDYNCNGKLDPGNVAVAQVGSSSSTGTGNTDANGRLDIKVTYPRDHSYWTEVTLVVSTTVQGTQSSTSTTFMLQGTTKDYACTQGPPGPISPYGVAATCVDPR